MRATTILSALALATPVLAAPPESVTLTIAPVAHNEPYTGRLYVAFLPASSEQDPIDQAHAWFNPPPLAAWDVEDLAPGTPVNLRMEDALLHMADSFDDSWGTGDWNAQAFARVNQDVAKPGTGAGDPYSTPVAIDMDTEISSVSLILAETVEPRPFAETDTDKLFAIRSPRLSAFHGRDITMNASVRLPNNYHETLEADPNATFPVLYIVTGFGGTHKEISRYAGFYTGGIDATLLADIQPIIVVPDATNYWGHSVFANSEVTGPWGDALVHELIPALEAVYHGEGPDHRYVTGVSSGGWSSLWLQLEYPEHFAGAWSHAPDPVDFHAFQTPNVYNPTENMYTLADGSPRPLARRTDAEGNDNIMLYEQDFIERETVMGPGGQIESFEAVFSPADEDGSPVELFDRETGNVSSETATSWEAYDITKKMTKEWANKKPALAGKLRVYGGEIDNFYLGESVALLREALVQQGLDLQDADEQVVLDADADIRVIDGMTHTLYGKGNTAMWNTIHHRWQSR